MPTISLITHEHQSVTGLSRYTYNLYQGLQRSEGATPALISVDKQPLATMVSGLTSRFGLDVVSFSKTYPLAWPVVDGNIAHLTHRSYSTLLWKKVPFKVVVTVHDIIHFQNRKDPSLHIYQHRVHSQVDAWSIRLLRRADMVLASSEYTRQALIDDAKLLPERITTIYLGVDAEHFKPQAVPDDFYERYGLSREHDYLVHISSEEQRKNIAAILDAFAIIYKDYPQARFLKIGRPLYQEPRVQLLAQIERLGLQDAVIFIDNIPDEDLPLFYNASKMLGFPSKAEGFGFPVLEAMASGTPVVCSQATSLPELAGDAALLVEPSNIEGLAESIRRILNDPELAANLSEKGRARAESFSWDRTIQQTLAVYERLKADA